MHILGRWNHGKTNSGREYPMRVGPVELVISPQVAILEDQSAKLLYDGTIFDQKADRLLTKQAALDTAFGHFTYIKLLKHEQEVIIGTDRLGFSPLYYCTSRSGLLFSTSLTFLKYEVFDPTPDYEAIEEIVNLGSLLGDKTPVRQIKRLDFGSRIHLRDSKITIRQYWSPEEPTISDRRQYVPVLIDKLAEALDHSRSHPGSKTVLLSGGEDSRLIALAAHRASLEISLATQSMTNVWGYEDNLAIASEVATCLNVPHLKVEFPRAVEYLNDSVIRNYWLGFESRLHAWAIRLLFELPSRSLIYDGIAGDVTINAHWARLYPARYSEVDVDRIAGDICGESSTLAANPQLLESTLFDRVKQELLRFPDCAARLDYFYLFNRARRNITGLAQLYHLFGNHVCYPFLYYPLFMHSLSLRPLDKLDLFFERECMKTLHPEAAAIPTTRDHLSERYRKDLRSQHFARIPLRLKKIKFCPETMAIFPSQRRHLQAFLLSRSIGVDRLMSNLDWRVHPMGWVNDYFDWLHDYQPPQLPAIVEQPGYIQSHQTRSSVQQNL